MFDTLLERMQGHERATRDIISRLDMQGHRMKKMEDNQATINDKNEKRFATVKDWGSTISDRMRQLETKVEDVIQHSAQQKQGDTTMASTNTKRLRLLEEHQAAVAATSKKIAQDAARTAVQEQGAAAPKPHMHADTDATPEFTLIVAGFGRDRPAETIEGVLRRLMPMTSAGTRLGLTMGTGNGQYIMAPASHSRTTNATYSTVPGFRAFSPWLFSSQAHIICSTEAQGRSLLQNFDRS